MITGTINELLSFLGSNSYMRDVRVSSRLYSDGEILTIMRVFAFPPKESCITWEGWGRELCYSAFTITITHYNSGAHFFASDFCFLHIVFHNLVCVSVLTPAPVWACCSCKVHVAALPTKLRSHHPRHSETCWWSLPPVKQSRLHLKKCLTVSQNVI